MFPLSVAHFRKKYAVASVATRRNPMKISNCHTLRVVITGNVLTKFLIVSM